LTYTNELEVEIDFSDVDPQLLKDSPELSSSPVPVLVNSSGNTDAITNSPSESEETKPKLSGRASRFFNRSKNE
jgi:hypothetical protein